MGFQGKIINNICNSHVSLKWMFPLIFVTSVKYFSLLDRLITYDYMAVNNTNVWQMGYGSFVGAPDKKLIIFQ